MVLQEQGEAMELLLSDACEQQPKPTIAFVGATIQPDLSHTASSMVRLSSRFTGCVGFCIMHGIYA